MMPVVVRTEETADYTAVFALNVSAFEQQNEAVLVNALRNSDAFIPGLSLVATVDNKIAGHILFSKIIIKSGSGEIYDSLSLAPMAVLPELQNQGIGSMLVRNGLQKAAELGFESVIVLGHENYYPRFGFLPAKKWGISAPFDVPDNVFMGIELVPNGLTHVSGTVIYPKEFDEV